MKIIFEKISDKEHKLSIIRRDGSSESILCESRSYLNHDLTHFALETEAGLSNGFWGRVADGQQLTSNDDGIDLLQPQQQKIRQIEAVVGVLHNLSQEPESGAILQNLHMQGDGLGWQIPQWLNEDLIDRVRERLRRLKGHWQATAYGRSMTLTWEIN